VSFCRSCGAENLERDAFCAVCDEELVAAPLRRDGTEFEATRGAVPPPACVKCGAPADQPKKPTDFYWHHPALYLLIFAGVVVYAIVAIAVRKRFVLAVPLCAEHLARRRRLRWTGGALLAAAVVLPIACLMSQHDSVQATGCIASVACFIACIVVFVVSEKTLRPKLITDQTARFAGADERFLAMLE
jgi:hypothetical protein